MVLTPFNKGFSKHINNQQNKVSSSKKLLTLILVKTVHIT